MSNRAAGSAKRGECEPAAAEETWALYTRPGLKVGILLEYAKKGGTAESRRFSSLAGLEAAFYFIEEWEWRDDEKG